MGTVDLDSGGFQMEQMVIRIQELFDSDTDLFYCTRGNGTLILNRRGSVSGPTGSYCCVVPASIGEVTFCVELGEWLYLHCHYIELLSFSTVTVVSTTAPPSTIVLGILPHCLHVIIP